ncbi:MAG: quinone-dependent dihydroorotate dehydrogenase [Patescibacteria group bacterium]|nr:quinone-dependent dihydroorotate dehydrogenase [Patescibacteria group bacterium]
MKHLFIKFTHFLYKNILQRIIFLFNSEAMHDFATFVGEFLGKFKLLRSLTKIFLNFENRSLSQKINGIYFKNPIGLAAGFDYQARLMNILPSVGFGFETIGTITNKPYKGNPKPRLGRLVKSQSLMVYKGFKNEGIMVIVKKLKNKKFEIPIGLSIGKTNSQKDNMTQKDAVLDIVSAFKITEKANSNISYYELNISCPNLYGNVTFYTPGNLHKLLTAVTKLNLKKPLFIKMPISKSDTEIIKMLDVIVKFPVNGVIFGNTQNNRKNKSFVKEELKKYPVGNFSGKPTFERSNELIRLAFQKYGKKLTIIGCGGVFSGKDAYRKIRLGASLVQFITGLVFEGPQLAAQINLELSALLKRDGFKHISEAIGIDV